MKALIILTILLSSCMATSPNTSAAADKDSPTPPSKEDTAVKTLFNFSTETPEGAWRIQDDRVMGGRSNGKFMVTEEGHGRFFGDVSLENNGGFSSVRRNLDSPVVLEGDTAFSIRLKGDGKSYNFRVRPPGERYSFTYKFETSGDWETVRIPFASMKATFRGYDLTQIPNYSGTAFEEMRILIGNKKPQSFELLIDVIEAM